MLRLYKGFTVPLTPDACLNYSMVPQTVTCIVGNICPVAGSYATRSMGAFFFFRPSVYHVRALFMIAASVVWR